MKRLLLTLFSVMLVTFLARPTLGGGWVWDIGNGAGFAAFAGLLYLSKPGNSGKSVRAHQLLGFTVLGVATLHVFWFLLLDAAVIEYVKWDAPIYMWAGILGFIFLVGLICIGLPEYHMRLHRHYASFKYWHRSLALVTVLGTGYHILGSGMYLSAPYQLVLFASVILMALTNDQVLDRGEEITRRTSQIFVLVATLCVVFYAGIRNISL